MRYGDYRSNFYAKRALLRFTGLDREIGPDLAPRARADAPPWALDWSILYKDGHHIRVKEAYTPMAHPNYLLGTRTFFSFQYGATTGLDRKGLPRTTDDVDTIVRFDNTPSQGPHMHYGRKPGHIFQQDIEGSLVISNIELFDFIEAVETHRQSGGCPMDEILFFKMREVKRR